MPYDLFVAFVQQTSRTLCIHMAERVDGFVGTETEYTSYLERELLAIRQRLRLHYDSTCPAQVSAPPREPSLTRLLQWERQALRDTPIEIPGAPVVNDERVLKRKRTSEPYWMRCANSLIAQTPKAKSWSNALREQGIHGIMTSGNAVACLLDSKFEPHLSVRGLMQEDGERASEGDCTLDYLKIYAETTAMRWTLASTALALANFQKFLVLSACAVLMEGETSIARILDIVRICIGENSTDTHCKRTVTAAKYLNVLMDTLNIHKWGHRASELPLLCE